MRGAPGQEDQHQVRDEKAIRLTSCWARANNKTNRMAKFKLLRSGCAEGVLLERNEIALHTHILGRIHQVDNMSIRRVGAGKLYGSQMGLAAD